MKDKHTISLLNEISELIYVADIDTYELLFVNQTGIEQLGLKDYHNKKCYEVLQNQSAPCSFCTNSKLCYQKFYNWEITNPVYNRHYLLKDKLVHWFGRQARLEIAFDITDREIQKQELQNALGVQNLISRCVHKLYQTTKLDETINDILQIIGEFLVCDRCYIFKIKEKLMDNTHEWCAPLVTPQQNNLQQLDLKLISDWIPAFEKMQCVDLRNIEEIKDSNPKAYATLAAQDITSLLVAPIFLDDKLYGYLGIDNYDTTKVKYSSELLLSLSMFIALAIRHKKHTDMLHKLSEYDLLTGALNRNAFMRATNDFDPSAHTSIGIVYIDINGMKDINDKYGHHRGDTILVETAKEITSVFNQHSLFRIGGDEFVVIDFDCSEADFCDKVNHLKNLYIDPINENRKVAIGSCWSNTPDDLNLLLLRADSKMYTDKKNYYYGREKTTRYRHYLDDVLGLGNPKILAEALLNKRFHLYFQPKISLQNNQCIGSEALVRYHTEDGKLIMPDSFIPLLEDTHLIKELDLYVFEETCQQLIDWQQRGLAVKPVAINLSRRTLSHPNLAEKLFTIINKYSLDIRLLELEVTETIEAANKQHFIRALEELKSKGFSISIDDFGVKNANLSLFTAIDFDILKLDQSLIQTISTNKKTRILTRSLSLICRDLGIRLIAEGVENKEQLAILKELHCNEVQGFLFSRPLSLEDFEKQYLQP